VDRFFQSNRSPHDEASRLETLKQRPNSSHMEHDRFQVLFQLSSNIVHGTRGHSFSLIRFSNEVTIQISIEIFSRVMYNSVKTCFLASEVS